MAIIKLKQAEVQAELCDGPIEIIVPAINKTRAESIPEEVDVLPTSFLDGELMVAKELKKHISFRALLELDEHQVEKSGKKAKCCCPFHPDKTPSFVINETDDYANCYGCGWHGDVFKYEGECHKVDFKLG